MKGLVVILLIVIGLVVVEVLLYAVYVKIDAGYIFSKSLRRRVVSEVCHPPTNATTGTPIQRLQSYCICRLTNRYPIDFWWRFSLDGDKCADVLFVVFASKHAERELIRKTWGQQIHNVTAINSAIVNRYRPLQALQQWKIRLLFLVGVEKNQEQLKNINSLIAENEEFKDLIVADFQESYENLTLKTVAMLYWARDQCEGLQFLVKTDADIYVDVVNAVWTLWRWRKFSGRALIAGRYELTSNNPVQTGKNRLPVKEYPVGKPLPRFIHGPFYAISGFLVQQLIEHIPRVPFVRLEDVYLALVIDRINSLNAARQPNVSKVFMPIGSDQKSRVQQQLIATHFADMNSTTGPFYTLWRWRRLKFDSL